MRENDRVVQYLTPYLGEYVFDELSDNYLERAELTDILGGVSVPINKKETEGITVLKLATNMAFVIGVDPNFNFKDNYVRYILKYFDKDFSNYLIQQGLEHSENKDYLYSIIFFRAAFVIDPDNFKAYYCYGRACKDLYELGDDEEYIGRFKAESLDSFEVTTIKNPNFSDAFYFLGYAYLNMGLYIKAKLTWDEYVKLANIELGNEENDLRANELSSTIMEVIERLQTLNTPIEIEKGYNLVISGKYEEGIVALNKYKDGEYKTWWPLWFYLGTAYMEIAADLLNEEGKMNEIIETSYLEAASSFNEVLKYSPSNQETVKNLITIYEKLGDKEKLDKFTKKLAILEENFRLDTELKIENDKKEGKLN